MEKTVLLNSVVDASFFWRCAMGEELECVLTDTRYAGSSPHVAKRNNISNDVPRPSNTTIKYN